MNLCHGRSHRQKNVRDVVHMLEKGNKLVCSDEQCGYVENIENNKDKLMKIR